MNKLLMGTSPVLLALCAGCSTQYQPMGVDPGTGYLTSRGSETLPYSKATVNLSLKTDLGKYQGTTLVTGDGIVASKEAFLVAEMQDLGAFSDNMDSALLQQRLIAAGVTDKVPETKDVLGLNKAYRAYKPFLWVHFQFVGVDGGCTMVMIANDPGDDQDLFKATIWVEGCGSVGLYNATDQDTWYPLFNSFIDWAAANGAKVKLSQAGATH